MNITRDNYESFFLDYLEGILEESLIDQFLDFLERNPDLKEELQLFENIRLTQEPVSFEGKKHLYKIPAHEKEAFEIKTVAWMEGDMDEEERCGFEASLALHPELEKQAALMASTRLRADTAVRYPHKHRLYKATVVVVGLKWLGRAAAALVLLWGLSTLFESGRQGTSPNQSEVAAVKEPFMASPSQQAPAAFSPAGDTYTEDTAAPEKAKAAPIKDQKATQEHRAKPLPGAPLLVKREEPILEQIPARMATLETEPVEARLAAARAFNGQNTPRTVHVMTLDEYLALRAKKATGEGLLSAHRLLRAGLNVVSELSGDRIGYRVKKGKVASVEFESKLLAFEIPLEKK